VRSDSDIDFAASAKEIGVSVEGEELRFFAPGVSSKYCFEGEGRGG